MSRYYVSSAGWTAVTAWAASTAYSVGDLRRQLAAVAFGNERVFRCTTAGTSGGSEPTWNLGAGATTNDNTAVWTEVTGQEAYQTSGGAWNAPAANNQLYLNQSTGRAATGDIIYVRSDSAETNAGALTYGKSTLADPVYIVCVQSNCTIPPVDADLTTGASISTTGAANINLNGRYFWRGIAFQAGSGASTGSINIGVASGAGPVMFQNCQFKLNNTSASSVINFGNSSANSTAIELLNTTMVFGSTSQKITMTNVYSFCWRDTASAIPSGSIPTTFWTLGSNIGPILIDGVDLSALTGTIFTGATGSTLYIAAVQFQNCVISTSATVIGGTTQLAGQGPFAIFDNCWAADGTTYKMIRATVGGAGYGIISEAIMCPTGGATDGVSQFSWKANTTVGGNITFTPASPWRSPWVKAWNTATGAAKTITIEILCDKGALLSAAKLWLEVEYLGTASSPRASLLSSTSFAYTATTPTAGVASTASWNAGTLASRANSTAYSLGDYRKVSTAPGLVFKCTTAGTTAGSIPAAYATAVDGSAVTDGSAVFTALYRQKLSLTVTPQQVGWLAARVCYVDSTSPSNPIWIDPRLTIS